MKTDFTTGIPEIDRLTGSSIKNGSFLLAAGNDDEGMLSFLAEIENINERHAGKEKNGLDGCRIVKMISETSENRDNFCRLFGDEKKEDGDNQNLIIIIESISEWVASEFHSKEKRPEEQNEEQETIRWIRKIRSFLKTESNDELKHGARKESRKMIVIGLLHENIFSIGTENRIKHLSDSYFRFTAEEKGTQLERTICIYKYNDGEHKGGDISGKILKYNLEDGKIRIETKKRIY
jgi:hypothetical protein